MLGIIASHHNPFIPGKLLLMLQELFLVSTWTKELKVPKTLFVR